MSSYFNQADFDRSVANLTQQITNVYKSVAGVGASDVPALIPPNVSSVITTQIQFVNPFNMLMTPQAWAGEKGWAGTRMTWPNLTSLRPPGNVGGEKSQGIQSSTGFTAASVNLKAKKSRFEVWNLGRAASEGYVDLIASQMMGEATAFGLDFAIGFIFDNSNTLFSSTDSTVGAWERSLWTSIQTNRIDRANTTTGLPEVQSTLSNFTNQFVQNMRAGGEGHKKVWIMSPEMA